MLHGIFTIHLKNMWGKWNPYMEHLAQDYMICTFFAFEILDSLYLDNKMNTVD